MPRTLPSKHHACIYSQPEPAQVYFRIQLYPSPESPESHCAERGIKANNQRGQSPTDRSHSSLINNQNRPTRPLRRRRQIRPTSHHSRTVPIIHDGIRTCCRRPYRNKDSINIRSTARIRLSHGRNDWLSLIDSGGGGLLTYADDHSRITVYVLRRRLLDVLGYGDGLDCGDVDGAAAAGAAGTAADDLLVGEPGAGVGGGTAPITSW